MLGQWQGLQKTESKATAKTSTEHRRELSIIEKLLDAYLAGFSAIGSLTRTRDNDLQYAWLMLVTRSFNSMRCAHILLERGYYTQALCLLRSVEEDWLIAKDCGGNSPALEALLHDKGQLGMGHLSFSKMAERVEKKLLWDSDYGHLSLFAHPRPLSLRVLVDRSRKQLRLGADYEEALFLSCCEVLVRAAIRVGEFIVSLLGSKASDWQIQTLPIFEEATDWLKALREQYGRGSG